MRISMALLTSVTLTSWPANSIVAQSSCLHEPGTWSFNKTEWWTAFPGTEDQFLMYWAMRPQERDSLVGFWQMHPSEIQSRPDRLAQRVAIVRDCGYDGWDYVAVSLYQQGEGSERLAEKRRILFVMRSTDEPGVYDLRYPTERERPRDEARLDVDKLLLIQMRSVESWFRL